MPEDLKTFNFNVKDKSLSKEELQDKVSQGLKNLLEYDIDWFKAGAEPKRVIRANWLFRIF